MYKFEQKKLEKKFDEFADHLSNIDCWVAGGAITSIFTNKEINDFDIYFKNKEELLTLLEDLNGEFTLMSHTDKATLISKSSQDAQLIRFKYFENPEEIFDTFDFTVCMGAYSFKKKEFYFHDDFMKHNAQKVLKFNQNTAFPYISMLRVDKYKSKGYHISKPELTKIMLACSNKEIKSYEDAVDQLGGMYGNNISNLVPADGDFSIDLMYDVLSDLDVSDSDFDMPNGVRVDSDEIKQIIENGKIKVFKIKDKYFKITDNDIVKVSGTFGSKPAEVYNEMIKSGFAEEIDIQNHYKKGTKLYKFVSMDGNGTLRSCHRNDFVYPIGRIVDGGKNGVFNLGTNKNAYHYFSDRKDAVMIELEITDKSEVVDARDGIQVRYLKVVRVVPKDEYNTTESKEEYLY